MGLTLEPSSYYFISLAMAIIVQLVVVTFWAGRIAAKIDSQGERLLRIESQLDSMNGK